MDVPGAVVADQVDQVWVQRQVTVVVQFPDRDVQPLPDTDSDRVGCRPISSLTRSPVRISTSQTTRTSSRRWVGGAQELRGGSVVEGFGQRVVLAWQVTGDRIGTRRGVRPAPFVDRMKNIRSCRAGARSGGERWSPWPGGRPATACSPRYATLELRRPR